ncbi:hypothetical protein CPHO_01540 [Corynebacterium phocae]|uniref:Uncharacterized protein n=1 Tax=Corynebacterium phocae TaxID=161895 RepID=A0A1L7D1H1_9CORY|nr:hypothetical protein [Corynebacterium phocae]APT91811.1 hypothetical protein CPHO_01540 [Corynebacterium phocae]
MLSSALRRQAGLGGAIAQAHSAGFPVGLHTCGYAAAVILKLVADPLTTPDWVGLDIKALSEGMEGVIQGLDAWQRWANPPGCGPLKINWR